MAWVGTVTNAGNTMLAALSGGGHTLTILDATAGTGTRSTSDMASATALVSEVGSIQIAGKQESGGAVKIRARVTPRTTGYTVKEIGIWAQLDSGSRTLFSIHQNTDGVIVPASSEDPNFIFDLISTYAPSNTDNFSVTVDPSAVVSYTQMTSALANEKIVSYGEQTLTDAQKTQARGNIGAAPSDYFSSGILKITQGGTGMNVNPSMKVNLSSESQASVFQVSPQPGVTGVLPVTHGGTGNSSNPQMKVNLSSESSASPYGSTPQPGVIGILPITHGGTGGSSVESARLALGLGNTSGPVPVANGGTGQSVNPSMLVKLDDNGASNVFQAYPKPGVTGVLPVANGGTGASSVAAARNALGLGNTSGALPIANGGTGASNEDSARTNLGLGLYNIKSLVSSASFYPNASGGSASVKAAYRFGPLVYMRLLITDSSIAVSSGTEIGADIVLSDSYLLPVNNTAKGIVVYSGNLALKGEYVSVENNALRVLLTAMDTISLSNMSDIELMVLYFCKK